MVVEGIWVVWRLGKVLLSFHVVGSVCVWRHIWIRAFPSPSKMPSTASKRVAILRLNYEGVVIDLTRYMVRFPEFTVLFGRLNISDVLSFCACICIFVPSWSMTLGFS